MDRAAGVFASPRCLPAPFSALPWAPREGVPSVAVLVELVHGPLAGGHLKCWERFAEAAAGLGPRELGMDLTVYVLGDRPRVRPLSAAVRFVALPPVLPSTPLVRWTGIADVTDLSPYHPLLARLLPHHDLWHLTHNFAFAATALRLGRHAPPGTRPGMIASVHTDVPALAAAVIRGRSPVRAVRAVRASAREPGRTAGRPPVPPPVRPYPVRPYPDGRGPVGPGFPGGEGFPGGGGGSGFPGDPGPAGGAGFPVLGDSAALTAGAVRRIRDRMLRACDLVLVPTDAGRAEIAAVVGAERVRPLGRGMDRTRFRPDPAARAELARVHGVPTDRPAVLFAGRLDPSKRVMVLAEAVRRLRMAGHAVHLVVAGDGPDAAALRRALGPDLTLLGTIGQEQLARVCPACEVFAFPSRSETAGNVVAEAMACHLPVVLPAGARTTSWLAEPGSDGVVVEQDDPEGWAAALAPLLSRPERRAALGARAGDTARRRIRSWTAVLTEDLLPAWKDALPGQPRTTEGPVRADGPAGAGGPEGPSGTGAGDPEGRAVRRHG